MSLGGEPTTLNAVLESPHILVGEKVETGEFWYSVCLLLFCLSSVWDPRQWDSEGVFPFGSLG